MTASQLPGGIEPRSKNDSAIEEGSYDSEDPDHIKVGFYHIFDSLHYRDHRLIWVGQISWYTALVTEHLARNWLVWMLTGSALSLAFVNLLTAVTTLAMTLPAGVVADRFNKKKVLVWCQLVTFSSYLTITTLVLCYWIELWHIYLFAIVTSISMAFNLPTRQSLIPRVVPADMVVNAFALNQIAMSFSRAIAPGIAGMLIGLWPSGEGGAGTAFIMTTGVFLVVIVTTFMLRVPGAAPIRKENESAAHLLKEGLVFVISSRGILSALIIATVTMAFGMAHQTLLPVVADTVFNIGVEGYGLLTAVNGIGALFGGVVLASAGNLKRKGSIFFINALVLGCFNILLGASGWLWIWVAFLAMFALGAGSSLVRVLGQTIVLEQTPPNLQGRVMGVYHMDRALMPLGAMVGGTLTDVAGASWALMILGAICVVSVIAIGFTQRLIKAS